VRVGEKFNLLPHLSLFMFAQRRTFRTLPLFLPLHADTCTGEGNWAFSFFLFPRGGGFGFFFFFFFWGVSNVSKKVKRGRT